MNFEEAKWVDPVFTETGKILKKMAKNFNVMSKLVRMALRSMCMTFQVPTLHHDIELANWGCITLQPFYIVPYLSLLVS